MQSFEFSLLVDGLDPRDDASLSALFARSQDITVGERGDLAEISFYAEASEAKTAVLRAIEMVETTVTCSRVVLVDDDLVAASDVAERLECSPEIVRLWATGQRGPGAFPTPRGFVGSHQMRVWRWADVHAWLMMHRPADVTDDTFPIPSAIVDELNANHLSRTPKAPVLRMHVSKPRSTYSPGEGLSDRPDFDATSDRPKLTL